MVIVQVSVPKASEAAARQRKSEPVEVIRRLSCLFDRLFEHCSSTLLICSVVEAQY